MRGEAIDKLLGMEGGVMSHSDKKGYVKAPVNPHNEPYVDELNSLLESLHEHDERSLILNLAAFAEDTLEQLLLNYLREPKQAKELVTGFNAPLGTFSARIRAAFVLGLMDRDDYLTLDLFRKIRNKFAHNWSGVSLDREDIASLINNFSSPRSKKHMKDEFASTQISARRLIEEKVSDVIIDLRMLAKHIDRRGLKAQLLMGDRNQVLCEAVEVDELPDK